MLNRRRMLLGGTVVAAAALSGAALVLGSQQDKRASAEVIAWLKANALALKSAEPGTGWQDLEPLRARLAKARIVSLGEATHGTREFFQLKHRMIEYCVSELGFTTIAFEANYGTMLAVNDYVLGGKGNASGVAAGLGFPIWDTEEVIALVEWVRAWNRANERKVKFHGLDIQGSAGAALHVLGYLERVAPALAAASERSLAPLASHFTFNRFLSLPVATQEEVVAQIKIVIDSFAAGRARWIERSSDMEWHLARLSAVMLDQFVRLKKVTDGEAPEAFAIRDDAMAGNMRALLEAEGPGSKALLWAHNGHVKRAKGYDFFAMRPLDVPTMGSFLHAAFGAEYMPIGFAFNQGSFQAWGNASEAPHGFLASHTVGPATEGMVDAVLAATGIPLFALDLARVPADGPVARWMASKPYQRMIGAGFALEREHRIDYAADPRDNFDVLLFVETTKAARGNRRAAPGNTDPAANQAPTNLMLAGANQVPDGWRAIEASYFLAPVFPYATAVVGEASPNGGSAVRIARPQSPVPWGDGALGQSFPAAPWRGRRFIFSAAIRAEATRIGTGAQLVVRISREQKDAPPILALASEAPVRSLNWVRRSVAVDIPADAHRIEIGLVVTGNAAGWFGDLALETGGPARVSHGEYNLSEVPVGAHHRERVGHLFEWEGFVDRQ